MRRTHVLAVALLLGAPAACGRDADDRTPATDAAAGQAEEYAPRLRTLETESGIRFPADARILHAEEGGRDDEAYGSWLIHSASRVDRPGSQRVEIPTASALRVVERLLPKTTIGKATDSTATVSEWSNARGSWRSTGLATESGYYVDLERLTSKPASP